MYLTLPGIGGSGPDHWQTHWENCDTRIRRVEQEDWNSPNLEAWLRNTSDAVRSSDRSVVLIAHSLSCLLVPFMMHADEEIRRNIAGLFLVAVPDPRSPVFPKSAADFANHPKTPLWCPVLSLISEDDPYGATVYASALTQKWGGHSISLGKCGHVNEASGLADWGHGRDLLSAFAAGIGHDISHLGV